MAKTITITLPDDMRVADICDYIQKVADQIDHGYLGGTEGPDQRWEASPL